MYVWYMSLLQTNQQLEELYYILQIIKQIKKEMILIFVRRITENQNFN